MYCSIRFHVLAEDRPLSLWQVGMRKQHWKVRKWHHEQIIAFDGYFLCSKMFGNRKNLVLNFLFGEVLMWHTVESQRC